MARRKQFTLKAANSITERSVVGKMTTFSSVTARDCITSTRLHFLSSIDGTRAKVVSSSVGHRAPLVQSLLSIDNLLDNSHSLKIINQAFLRREGIFLKFENQGRKSTSLAYERNSEGEYGARAIPLFIYAGHFAARRNAILFLRPPHVVPTLLLIRMRIYTDPPPFHRLETFSSSSRPRSSPRFASTLPVPGWKRTPPRFVLFTD